MDPRQRVAQVEDVEFLSHGTVCRGSLYRPRATAPPPLVVMAHGLGGTREMSLRPIAETFALNGYAALVFDYRCFGASDGSPRQLLSIPRQQEDYRAAVRFARDLPGIDDSRIVLWGTSFSGGHVIALGRDVARGRLPGVAAIVAQCPFTDGPSSVRASGPGAALRVGAVALRDELAHLLGRPPVMIPTAAPGGRAALMMSDDAWPGVRSLAPGGADPLVEVTARIGTRIGRYRPGPALRTAAVPTLLAVCEKDAVTPARATLRHAARGSAQVRTRSYPYGHFDIYDGPARDRVMADQLAFLGQVLGGAVTSRAPQARTQEQT